MEQQDERIELGGVHVIKILEQDGTYSLEVNTDDDLTPWETIGMLRVALQWELDSYVMPDAEEDPDD